MNPLHRLQLVVVPLGLLLLSPDLVSHWREEGLPGRDRESFVLLLLLYPRASLEGIPRPTREGTRALQI